MNILFPPNSRRRFLMGLILKAIKHPIVFMRNLRWRYIKGFFYNLRYSDISTVEQLVNFRIYDSSSKIPETLRTEIIHLDQLKIDDVKPLDFVNTNPPIVSIIIPVHNNWRFTYYCLKSIKENTSGIDYEVIVSNDCSTDTTSALLKTLKGIKIHSNESNQGYLISCNNASLQAKGKYIVFLNNDTYVLKNWLGTLISIAETDPLAGIVGSKIIDRYGRLQECGWKVGKDGWAFPFGRGENPDLQSYSYLRPVNSISGACFLIRNEIFSQVGRFDTRYVPGYFEEIDLSFAVRDKGYKVLVEPKSVIIHFGSVTYGNKKRQKYSANHHAIFFKKWKYRLMAK